VAKGVVDDSKQAQTQHITARGLFENISTCATNIYSTYKATFIPNRMNINSNDKNNNNNNINGVDNLTE
jgi:hypothetical protein